MSDATPIDDETYVLGPVGIWPFRYRVKIIDQQDGPDMDGSWLLILEKRNIGSGRDWLLKGHTTLYETGVAYENRTKKP